VFLQNSRCRLFSEFNELFFYRKFGEPGAWTRGPGPRQPALEVHRVCKTTTTSDRICSQYLTSEGVFHWSNLRHWLHDERNRMAPIGGGGGALRAHRSEVARPLRGSRCEARRHKSEWGKHASVIPRFEKTEPKPLYVWSWCSNYTYSNNMIRQMQCLIKQSNISYIMTRRSKKRLHQCSKKLSVAWAFTDVDRWRGPPNNHL
jgi:hypothetical protein